MFKRKHNNENDKNETPSLIGVYILSSLFVVIAIITFGWQRDYHMLDKDYVSNYTLLGTFGDFTGGILGAVFSLISCILLVKTLKAQRNDAKKNSELMEMQRFNNLFFELLHLYQSEVSELSSKFVTSEKDGTKEVTKGTYKDFFYVEKLRLHKEFQEANTIFEDREEIRRAYTKFYIEHSSVAHCYRSLYRIYDLIDKSPISDKDKKEYIKILRAQLTESELLFLRYNAYSCYGQQFVTYLNKYNTLKHLPILDLLEFKKYWKNWPLEDRESLNVVLNLIRKSIFKLLKPRPTTQSIITLDSKKYSINVEISRPNMDKISIFVEVNKAAVKCNSELKALDYMSFNDIALFFKDYLLEIFYFSSFQRYNNYHELKLGSSIESTNDKNIIISSIYTTGRALNLSYNN